MLRKLHAGEFGYGIELEAQRRVELSCDATDDSVYLILQCISTNRLKQKFFHESLQLCSIYLLPDRRFPPSDDVI